MRKLLLSFALILPGCLIYSQVGSGTSSDPYRGTISTSVTWDDSYPGNTIFISRSGEPLTVTSGSQLTVGSGLTLSINGEFIIEPGAAVTAGTIINNGILKLESDETGIASLIFDSYSGEGQSQTELYLTGGYSTIGGINYYKWHYISTPTINPIPVGIFTANTYNLAQYVESVITSDPDIGWFTSGGYDYNNEVINTDYSFTNLHLGRGYNYYHTFDETYIITGSLNFSDVQVTLTCGEEYPYAQGFNLIGNPFSSCLDWDYLFNENLLPPGLDDAIYFTYGGAVASYVNGVGQGGATNTIPPMQGFFVKANQDNIQLTLPAEGRVHDITQVRYKSTDSGLERSNPIPLVRIKVGNDNSSDDAVIRFDEQALPFFDKSFDAYKLSKARSLASIWTQTNGIDYSINGLPFPDTTIEIPLGIFTATPGKYKLFLGEINLLDNYSVLLKDKFTNYVADLKSGGELTYNSPGGLIEDRFLIAVTKISATLPELISDNRLFKVYSTSGTINVIPLSVINEPIGTINIYDLTGRKVLRELNVELVKDEIIQFTLNSNVEGYHIVEIKAGGESFVSKVFFFK